MCTIAAPARAASSAASAISTVVTGTSSERSVVAPTPVTAHVMKTSVFTQGIPCRGRRDRRVDLRERIPTGDQLVQPQPAVVVERDEPRDDVRERARSGADLVAEDALVVVDEVDSDDADDL